MIVINKIVIHMYFHKNLHGAQLLGRPVYVYGIKFSILDMRENEIALRRLMVLRSCVP